MVINVVSEILINVPFTFLRKLPGISLGEFRKEPKINDGARLIYPSTLKVSKGIISDNVIITPLKKWELFRNNSILVRLLFTMDAILGYKDSLFLSFNLCYFYGKTLSLTNFHRVELNRYSLK